ncbi:hypothetical protein NHX12_014258, partial [Muraenolepis orangiensis]
GATSSSAHGAHKSNHFETANLPPCRSLGGKARRIFVLKLLDLSDLTCQNKDPFLEGWTVEKGNSFLGIGALERDHGAPFDGTTGPIGVAAARPDRQNCLPALSATLESRRRSALIVGQKPFVLNCQAEAIKKELG